MNFKIVIPILTGSLLLATVARAESSFGQSFFSKQKPAIIAVAAENLPLSGNNTDGAHAGQKHTHCHNC